MIINYIHVADNPNATWIFFMKKNNGCLKEKLFQNPLS